MNEENEDFSNVIKKYESFLDKLKEEYNNGNYEISHILEDRMYKNFIIDICNSKITTLEDIMELALYLKKNVIKKKYEKWYA